MSTTPSRCARIAVAVWRRAHPLTLEALCSDLYAQNAAALGYHDVRPSVTLSPRGPAWWLEGGA